MSTLIKFVKAHSVRIFAVASAASTVLARRYPDLPWEAVLAITAAILGIGEVSQRVEDRKTTQALTSTPTAGQEPGSSEDATPAQAGQRA